MGHEIRRGGPTRDQALPTVPGLELAARYRPARPGAQVGGDWYDALALPSGTTLVIGDVAGHDGVAAEQMAHLRAILRGIAAHRQAPSELLGRLDRANLAGPGAVATALVAHLEPIGAAGAQLTWSSAGHYAPVVVCPHGRAGQLTGRSDLLLGVDARAPRTDHVTGVLGGATLLLFTDGLVELRGRPVAERLAGLCAAASHMASEPLDVLLDGVLAAMAHTGEQDDVAVLAARPVG